MIHSKPLHAVVGNCWGAKDAKSTDMVAWWDLRLSTLILDYPHLLNTSSWFDKDIEKCLLNTVYQGSPYKAGANDFMEHKSETTFGWKLVCAPKWYACGEELTLNGLGCKSENLLHFRNSSWCWDKTEAFCGDL